MSSDRRLNQRVRIVIHGAVQGVGFRPFVYRAGHDLNLKGWVNNSPSGVFIEAEGPSADLEIFTARLRQDKPPAAYIQSLEATYLDVAGFDGFEIRASDVAGPKTTVILPDLATCPDCRRELFDRSNRRYRYPFTNCTNCGPRYSIITELPYDRPNTTMAAFRLCPACEAEYHDPTDRRFHAQPNACPVCGPRMELWNADGGTLACGYSAISAAAKTIIAGKILAVKGLGGFQFLVDARNEEAVQKLRRRKHREEKPFAVMFPTAAAVARHCVVSPLEEAILTSSQAPIVLLECHTWGEIAAGVAPGSPTLGAMLPYTPMHLLLMREVGFPVVATSGNLSNEPICIQEHDALDRLRGIADFFLVHNRPIVCHVDDSVVRVVMGRELVLRRARGYAPLPVPLIESVPTILAMGAHQKCSAALSVGNQVVLGQHIGDLETAAAVQALRRLTLDLPELYSLKPDIVACDLHPDYASTRMAESRSGVQPPDPYKLEPAGEARCREAQPALVRVQHHYAHVLSCMAENELSGNVLGVAWDGTGLGPDGTIWGGEFLLVNDEGFRRAGHLRPFLLPGGEQGVREPRRTALALLEDIYGSHAFSMDDLAPIASFTTNELVVLKTVIAQRLNTPVTTSAGRLFDAFAALIGLRQKTAYEGQAATLLEYAAHRAGTEVAYCMPVRRGANGYEIDWRPAVQELVSDIRAGRSADTMAAMIHNTLVNAIVELATEIGVERIALTGGCFQNKYLTERTVTRLRLAGFRPYWHQRIPPNDGGIALGQVMSAIRSQSCASQYQGSLPRSLATPP